MARHQKGNVAPADAEQSQEGEETQAVDPAAIPGGAAGMPQVADTNPRFAPQALTQNRELQPKRYMVTDGPRDGSGMIRYMSNDGYLAQIRPGIHVTENSHNIPHMRRQGIVVQLIPDIIEEEPTQASAET